MYFYTWKRQHIRTHMRKVYTKEKSPEKKREKYTQEYLKWEFMCMYQHLEDSHAGKRLKNTRGTLKLKCYIVQWRNV